MAIDDECVLVDPFEVDIRPINKLLLNSNVVKVFHSPRQDLEIIFHQIGQLPNPVFDTQIAAGFLGHNVQIGYGNLVASELGTKLKKSATYTDWSLRPLSDIQLSYASDDVTYLLQLYYTMHEKLKELNRIKWVDEDIKEKYLDVEIYKINPEDRFWHLKRVSSLKKYQLACAKELALWRENIAIKRDKPRRWIISDEQIIEICKQQPKKIEDLFIMRGAKASLAIQDARSILDCLKKGNSYKEKDLPTLKDKNKYCSNNNMCCCNYDIEADADLMCAIVRKKAHEYNMAPQTLTSNADLAKIANGVRSGISTLSGWRKKIVGNDLLDLMDGKITLKINDGVVEVERKD